MFVGNLERIQEKLCNRSLHTFQLMGTRNYSHQNRPSFLPGQFKISSILVCTVASSGNNPHNFCTARSIRALCLHCTVIVSLEGWMSVPSEKPRFIFARLSPTTDHTFSSRNKDNWKCMDVICFQKALIRSFTGQKMHRHANFWGSWAHFQGQWAPCYLIVFIILPQPVKTKMWENKGGKVMYLLALIWIAGW